jgi:hypothetical protein
MKRVRDSVLTFLALVLVVPAASAQTISFELSGGYSLLSYNHCCAPAEASVSKGWTATAAVEVVPWFSLVGEGGGDYFSVNSQISQTKSRFYSVAGGPRVTKHFRSFKVFSQLLLGATSRGYTTRLFPPFSRTPQATLEGGPHFLIYQPGVGLDVSLSRNFAIRFAADYRMTDFPGLIVRDNRPTFSEGTVNEPRFSSGFVWRP